MAANEFENILDLKTLEQYCDAIGAETLLKSVVLFEQLMPEYVDNLLSANEKNSKEILCSEAHKFKGAAGSIGLKRIQYNAQLIQHGEDPHWDSEHSEWLNVIVEKCQPDLTLLKQYLEKKV